MGTTLSKAICCNRQQDRAHRPRHIHHRTHVQKDLLFQEKPRIQDISFYKIMPRISMTRASSSILHTPPPAPSQRSQPHTPSPVLLRSVEQRSRSARINAPTTPTCAFVPPYIGAAEPVGTQIRFARSSARIPPPAPTLRAIDPPVIPRRNAIGGLANYSTSTLAGLKFANHMDIFSRERVGESSTMNGARQAEQEKSKYAYGCSKNLVIPDRRLPLKASNNLSIGNQNGNGMLSPYKTPNYSNCEDQKKEAKREMVRHRNLQTLQRNMVETRHIYEGFRMLRDFYIGNGRFVTRREWMGWERASVIERWLEKCESDSAPGFPEREDGDGDKGIIELRDVEGLSSI